MGFDDLLPNLTDPKLLADARTYSQHFDRAIGVWQKVLAAVIQEAVERNYDRLGAEVWQSYEQGELSRTTAMKVLNVADLDRLSSLEMPSIEELDQDARALEGIVVPSVGMPVGVETAAVLIESVLSFSLLWFWLFQREARLSESFPAAGTLFGAFARTPTSRLLFRALVFAPALAATLLAFRAMPFTWAAWVPAIPSMVLARAIVDAGTGLLHPPRTLQERDSIA